ncbi:hypothetical protein Tsubulata_008273 [Turnera subulata]|uniref:Remorin C-terminal domain-containing protein n=1 Tax=Turnera subulata TaxID=218843 RepID=A0A9Q0FA85_9ROSI|nr:hypothetical protein Tsubulata_008273 [Turnera subulata]
MKPRRKTKRTNYSISSCNSNNPVAATQENAAAAFTISKPISNDPSPRISLSGGGRRHWSLSSLSATSPDSPSPICSMGSCPLSYAALSPKSDAFSSDRPPSGYSSTRFQSVKSNFSKLSTPSIDEWVQKTRNWSGFYQNGLQNNRGNEILERNCSSKHRLSVSTAYHSTMASNDPEYHIPELASANEDTMIHGENLNPQPECTHQNDSDISHNSGRSSLQTRPVPYSVFLEDVKAKELKARADAWKQAEERELMNKLRMKEAAIREWEFKLTAKAMKDLKKLESKLERAARRTQDRITSAREKAKKKVMKERASTNEKISSIRTKSAIQGPESTTWLKRIQLRCFDVYSSCSVYPVHG